MDLLYKPLYPFRSLCFIAVYIFILIVFDQIFEGPKAVHEISQRLRHLARLKVRLDTGSDAPLPLIQYITPSKFDAVINAVEQESGVFINPDGRRMFQNPCFATKVGHCLNKCAQVRMYEK